MAGRKVVAWAISLCVSALAWGCGSAESEGSGPARGGANAAPIPVENLCPLFTSDLCVYLRECRDARYRDQAHCERELDCFGLPQLLEAVERGAVDYDPSKVGECHARFLSSPCTFGAFLFTPDIYEVLAFCPGTITPRLAQGEACSSHGECSGGMQCLKDTSGTCPGTCQPLAGEGESCDGNARCAEGLDCGADLLCVAETKAGDACTSFCDYSLTCAADEICPDNLWCDRDLASCQLGRLEGEPCGRMGSGIDYFAAECAVHLWCDAPLDGMGVCRRPSPIGGTCNDQRDACEEDRYCELGLCVGPAAAGSPCNDDEHCQSGLVCNAGECATPGPEGSACEGNGDCAAGLVCTDLECAAARYPGDACAADGSCTFGRCVVGTCDYHAKVGEDCILGEDCATGECVDGACYDHSLCNAL